VRTPQPLDGLFNTPSSRLGSLRACDPFDVFLSVREREPIEIPSEVRISAQREVEFVGDLDVARRVVDLHLHDNARSEVDTGNLPGGLVDAETDAATASRHGRARKLCAVDGSSNATALHSKLLDYVRRKPNERTAAWPALQRAFKPGTTHMCA
jgi:hypothetical protein